MHRSSMRMMGDALRRHPEEAAQVLPDGMKYLFDCTGRLHDYDIHTDGRGTIVASAFKY